MKPHNIEAVKLKDEFLRYLEKYDWRTDAEISDESVRKLVILFENAFMAGMKYSIDIMKGQIPA